MSEGWTRQGGGGRSHSEVDPRHGTRPSASPKTPAEPSELSEKVTSHESAKMHRTRTPQGGKIAQKALPSMGNGAAHDGESMRRPATLRECVLGHDGPDERWNREGAAHDLCESVAGSHLEVVRIAIQRFHGGNPAESQGEQGTTGRQRHGRTPTARGRRGERGQNGQETGAKTKKTTTGFRQLFRL